jgi:hypothetical protein
MTMKCKGLSTRDDLDLISKIMYPYRPLLDLVPRMHMKRTEKHGMKQQGNDCSYIVVGGEGDKL